MIPTSTIIEHSMKKISSSNQASNLFCKGSFNRKIVCAPMLGHRYYFKQQLWHPVVTMSTYLHWYDVISYLQEALFTALISCILSVISLLFFVPWCLFSFRYNEVRVATLQLRGQTLFIRLFVVSIVVMQTILSIWLISWWHVPITSKREFV